MRTIIGIDGSEGSLAAVKMAGQVHSPVKDKLAFYFATPGINVDSATELAPEIIDRLRRDLTESVLDQAEAQLPRPWKGNVEHVPGVQDPRRGLIVAAQAKHADLIVVGARGLGPMTSWLLGSVSLSVAHAANLPVLVVRPRPSGRPAALRVLIACAHMEHTRAVADLLAQFTWPGGTVGRLIAVVESPFGNKLPEWLEAQVAEADEPDARSWLGRVRAETKAKRELLERQLGKLAWSFQTESPILVEGNPADEILKAIDREKIDLVVVGTHHPGLIARMLLGSTSEKVLSHAKCSVLVVPHAEKP